MLKPVACILVACAVLLPWGRAVAKPRVERPLAMTAREVDTAPTAAKRAKSASATSEEGPATKTPKSSKASKDDKAAKAKLSKKSKREPKVKPPCFAPEVHVARKRGDLLEHRSLSLTFCDGSPNPAALDSVSVLARARDVERPLMPEIRSYQRKPVDRGPISKRRQPDYLSEHVMRVHPDLLPRLQKVANRFAGRTIEIVSGHRPDARDTSRHHHGRALDIRVEGVSREALRDFLRGIDDTGVGYYPNSYFVHMDVRDKRGYWVDRSGPGEAADYGTWPPSRRDVDGESDRIVASAMRDLAKLGESMELEPATAPVREAGEEVEEREESEPHDEPADALTREEVARIRAEALSAIEAL